MCYTALFQFIGGGVHAYNSFNQCYMVDYYSFLHFFTNIILHEKKKAEISIVPIVLFQRFVEISEVFQWSDC